MTPEPPRTLDERIRAHHLQLRVALGVVAVLAGAAWLLDWKVVGAILVVPFTVLFYLVAIYLPRSPLR